MKWSTSFHWCTITTPAVAANDFCANNHRLLCLPKGIIKKSIYQHWNFWVILSCAKLVPFMNVTMIITKASASATSNHFSLKLSCCLGSLKMVMIYCHMMFNMSSDIGIVDSVIPEWVLFIFLQNVVCFTI